MVALEGFVAGQVGDDLALLQRRGAQVWRACRQRHHAQPGVDAGTAGRAGLGRRVLVDRKGVDLGAAVVVDEQLGFEGRDQPLQQRVVHRRAGEAELAYRRQVRAALLRLRQQVVIQGRHQVQVRYLFGGDRGQCRDRIEFRLAHEAAIDQRQCQQRAHAHGVIQRHHAEGAFAIAIAVLRHVRERRHALGALPARHALGFAGGARGVEHQREIVGAGLRQRVGRVGQPGVELRLRADRDAGDAGGQRRGVDRSRCHRFGDQHAGAAVGQAVVDLVGLGAPVERRDRHAHELAGPMQGGGLMAVLQNGQ